MLLGLAFLGVKAREYSLDYEEGLIPWVGWGHPTSPQAASDMAADPIVQSHGGAYPKPLRLFFYLYFVMTGMHAVHMLAGIGVLSAVAVAAYRGRYKPGQYGMIEISGLYWHFVDIVWVFLFPTLYLLRHVG